MQSEKGHISKPCEMILVRDQSKRILLNSNEIIYIKANTPYIELYTADKKYLEQRSLKEMLLNFDRNIFVRVHKSAIVNIGFVKNYTSRMNGDYDVEMQNGDIIRVSRNFATAFKEMLNSSTQVKV